MRFCMKFNNYKNKIVWCIVYIIIIIAAVLFFNLDDDQLLSTNNDTAPKGPISLDEALELLYSDKEDENVEFYENDIHTHIRIVKNVSFSGTYSKMDFDNFYIDNVVTQNKTYNNIAIKMRMPYGTGKDEGLENVNVDNLRIGDKIDVICSIANGLDFLNPSKREDYKHKYDDFLIYEKIMVKAERDDYDELAQKYSDKEKIYELDEFYDDLATVSNENLKRSDKIFYGIQFTVNAKCIKKLDIYGNYYLEYKIKRKDGKAGDDSLIINSQYNYVGSDNNNEDKYYLTKNYFLLPIENLVENKKITYNEKARSAIILENKENQKGYRDLVFKYTTTYTSKINLVRIDGGNDEEQEQAVFTKKVGVDEKIYIGDRVLFGNKLYWDVVDVDYKDNNKILIMLTNDSVEENIPSMSWANKKSSTYKDSDVRKYLNETFIGSYFTDMDIRRMYTTTLDVVVRYSNKRTEYDIVNDKIFILSDDDINEYKNTLTDPIATSFVRNQRYGPEKISLYRRRTTMGDEFKQDSDRVSEKWLVYPLVWINIG